VASAVADQDAPLTILADGMILRGDHREVGGVGCAPAEKTCRRSGIGRGAEGTNADDVRTLGDRVNVALS
jgi:hypothetical protein